MTRIPSVSMPIRKRLNRSESLSDNDRPATGSIRHQKALSRGANDTAHRSQEIVADQWFCDDLLYSQCLGGGAVLGQSGTKLARNCDHRRVRMRCSNVVQAFCA